MSALSESVPWFESPENGHQGNAVGPLIDLWLNDRELGERVAGLGWVVDGGKGESGWRPYLLPEALQLLADFAAYDREMAGVIVDFPWMGDRLTVEDASALEALYALAWQDRELARTALAFPWVADGVDSWETNRAEFTALDALTGLASIDRELGRLAGGWPWLADGVTEAEQNALIQLWNIAYEDLALGETALRLPWVADGVSRTEASSLTLLAEMALADRELAREVAGRPWFGHKYGALWNLSRIITEADPAIAQALLRHPGYADGLSAAEEVALHNLWEIALLDPEAARYWAANASQAAGDLGLHLLGGIFRLLDFADGGPEPWARLQQTAWFADGLDDEETALVTVLGQAASDLRHQQLFYDLLQTRYAQTATIALPMAGAVNIWVFSSAPFPPGLSVAGMIADTARVAEEFLGLPFPTSDIILLVDEAIPRGAHLVNYMFLHRPGDAIHETAHYYFDYYLIHGPTWLIEGGAEFIQALVNDHTGAQPLAARRVELRQGGYARCTAELGIENLWRVGRDQFDELCIYHMGEQFVTDLYEILGQETLTAALKDWSATLETAHNSAVPSVLTTGRGIEEEIYRTLLRHTPEGRRAALLELYREQHGGPFLPP